MPLNRRLRPAERRCTIAHETAHIDRGDPPTDQVLRAREELVINKLVARAQIPLAALGAALRWSREPSVVADILWVDESTLHMRVRILHTCEVNHLNQILEHLHTP